MNKIIKKVLLVLTMFVGSVMMISDVRAEEVFANINRVSYDGTVDYILPYKSLKLNDGYLLLNSKIDEKLKKFLIKKNIFRIIKKINNYEIAIINKNVYDKLP